MSSTAVPPELPAIIPDFPLPGRLVSAAPHGSGHINETYAAVFAESAGTRRYIFQKVNHRIFKNVPGLMDNVRRVTAHIAVKVRAASGDAAARRVLTLLPTRDGRAFTQDAAGKLTGMVINLACPSQCDESKEEFSSDFWHDVR